MLRKFVQAFLILAVSAGAVAAQSIPMGDRGASPEQVQKEQREERAAQRAMDKVPDKEQKKSDPWGNVRSGPKTSDGNKKPRP